MIATLTLGEPQIPLPPRPETAAQTCAQNAPASQHAALLKLLWLVAHIATLLLLGYRMPRGRRSAPVRRPSQAVPAQPAANAAAPAAPAIPRRKHRLIDRQMCLDIFAGINATFAAGRTAAPAQPAPALPVPAQPVPAQPIPVPAPAPHRPTPRPATHPSPAPHPAPPPPNRLAPLRRAAARPHPPPFKKSLSPPASMHVLFVAIS